MADLVTHYLTARIPTAHCERPIQAAFVAGVILPDGLCKLLDLVLASGNRFEVPTHTIVGAALYAYLFAFFFEERIRARAWLALFGGGLLHLFVDLLKQTMGSAPSAWLLFPFTTRSFELGLYDPLDWIATIPVAAAIVLLWEWRRGFDVWK
jgi:membrane-bound metal-dependent hydrolase YbcI (DUF457 family)